MTADAAERAPSEASRSPLDQAVRVALVVAFAAMAVAGFGVAARSTYGAQTSSDEPQYLLTALSLAEDFDLDIADELDRRAFEPFHEIDVNPQTFPLNDAGQQLSPHDPLLPLIAAPAMRIGGWVGVRLLLVGLGGLTAGITTWAAIRRFAVEPAAAAVGVGAFAVSAPLAAYSTQVFPEIAAALAVAVATAAATAPRLQRRHVIVTAVAVVALPWLSVKYLPVAAVIAAATGWRILRAGDRRTLGWATATVLTAGIIYLLVHQRIYGGWTVYATGDHFVSDGEFAVVGTDPDYVGRSRRLVGLLADRRFGLIPWAPIWLLAPAALAWFGFGRRRHRALVIGVIAAGWVVASFVALTMHGWWSPGRQVVVVTPLVAIAVAALIDRHPQWRWPAAVLGLMGAGNWIWLAVEASTDRRAIIVDFYETAAPGYRLVSWAFAQGWPQTAAADAVLAAWTVIVVMSMIVAGRAGRAAGVGQPTAGTEAATSGSPSLTS